LSGLFQARYKNTQRVLLVFAAQLTSDAAELASIAPRVQAASAIKSPHVSRVHGLVPHPNAPFIVVQDLQGKSLRESLTNRPQDWPMACRMAAQMATGLAALHAAKICHGQLCPVNVWLDPTSSARLLQYPLVGPVSARDLEQLPMADYVA